MSEHLYSVDEQGRLFVSDQGIIELAYQNKLDSFFEWQNHESMLEYVNSAQRLDTLPFDPRSPDVAARSWFTPEEYQTLDLTQYVLSRCATVQQLERAQVELEIVQDLGAEPIFRHLIYLVDQWRSRDLVWGVGRGSSVSCFLLYVIGVNKINPLDYDLDYHEFFKI